MVQSLCALSVTAYFSESRLLNAKECYEDKGEKIAALGRRCITTICACL